MSSSIQFNFAHPRNESSGGDQRRELPLLSFGNPVGKEPAANGGILVNKYAWKSFFALIIGFAILFVSAWFITNAYWRLSQSELTPNKISHTILRLIKLARALPPNQVIETFQFVQHPGIKVSFKKSIPHGLMPLYYVNINVIRKEILANPNHVNIIYPLDNNIFMHIHTHILRSALLKFQFTIAFIVWMAALFSLTYFIIRQLSYPLAVFVKGSERFAKDLNAPPIPEVGPKSTREAFQAFNQMQANLKQLIQDRTQMLAAISHDLKTPLTRLQLRLENLSPSDINCKMQKDIQQMHAMVNSILAFAQNDLQHEAMVPLDLNTFLESICDDMQDAAKTVTYHESHVAGIILAKPLALRRALENIIDNGLKYGKSVEVNLILRTPWAEILIADQGPGIPLSEQEKVFLPFYRLDKARTSETVGSGLGLSTAKDIIRSHGGHIHLKNRSQGGLEVTVALLLEKKL